ncbi:MAG: N-acetyl-gamma-glutamyl-phosphate reductase [Candidatus Omnitrophota bacterium]
MLRVGIIGASGYAGEELIKLLLRHPDVRLTYLSAKIEKPVPVSEMFGYLAGRLDLVCELPSVQEAAGKSDLVFLALPHTVSMEFVPALIKQNKKIIDLSADYRLSDTEVYAQWYHTQHKDKAHLEKFVYGLPELYREKIKHSDCIANPGCYPTAAILGLAPVVVAGLVAEPDHIVVDAKSGATGAGRKASMDFFFSEVNENFKGYKYNHHQHLPEINQELSKLAAVNINVVFCPHLLPVNRGILETIYIKLNKPLDAAKIEQIYKNFYKTEPFVRLNGPGKLPELKDVVNTNFCDIGFAVDESRKLLIVVSVIDNLLKGASGQAVQNMNIMCGFQEKQGLL